MSNQYSESLLESIDIICDSKIKSAINIEVIIGEINKIIDANKGIYQVRYQNAEFIAYADNSDYKVGNQVFVQISHNPLINYITGRIKDASQISAHQMNDNDEFNFDVATDDMTQVVGITEDGKLRTKPGTIQNIISGGGGSLEEDYIPYTISTDAPLDKKKFWIDTDFDPTEGEDVYLPLAGGTMQGNINMDNYQLFNLPEPTIDSAAATKAYVDNHSSEVELPPELINAIETHGLGWTGEFGFQAILGDSYEGKDIIYIHDGDDVIPAYVKVSDDFYTVEQLKENFKSLTIVYYNTSNELRNATIENENFYRIMYSSQLGDIPVTLITDGEWLYAMFIKSSGSIEDGDEEIIVPSAGLYFPTNELLGNNFRIIELDGNLENSGINQIDRKYLPSDKFNINILNKSTTTLENITADKDYEEIVEAINDKIPVQCLVSNLPPDVSFTYSSQEYQFNDICYSEYDNKYYAAAYDGVYESIDCKNWTMIANSTMVGSPASIVPLEDKIIVSGYITYDKSEWVPIEIDNKYRICYGNNMFVAMGIGRIKTIKYSYDGITWNIASLPRYYELSDIAFGNDVFVVVEGPEYSGSPSGQGILYSSDGINWTAVDLTPYYLDGWSLNFCHDAFFLTQNNDNPGFYRSVDGINWTSIFQFVDEERVYTLTYTDYVRYINGLYLISDGYSYDGINWYKDPNIRMGNGKYCVCNNCIVTTGNIFRYSYYSDNTYRLSYLDINTYNIIRPTALTLINDNTDTLYFGGIAYSDITNYITNLGLICYSDNTWRLIYNNLENYYNKQIVDKQINNKITLAIGQIETILDNIIGEDI